MLSENPNSEEARIKASRQQGIKTTLIMVEEAWGLEPTRERTTQPKTASSSDVGLAPSRGGVGRGEKGKWCKC